MIFLIASVARALRTITTSVLQLNAGACRVFLQCKIVLCSAGVLLPEQRIMLGCCHRGICEEESVMPVLLVPILWAGGAVVVLGGGYYVISHLVH